MYCLQWLFEGHGFIQTNKIAKNGTSSPLQRVELTDVFYQCFRPSQSINRVFLPPLRRSVLTCTHACNCNQKSSCRGFSLLRVCCLFIKSSGEDFFPVRRRINVFFFISSQLCLHVQLETICLFQFYASGKLFFVKKTKVWFHCCVINYLTKRCFHRHSSGFLESALFNMNFKYVCLQLNTFNIQSISNMHHSSHHQVISQHVNMSGLSSAELHARKQCKMLKVSLCPHLFRKGNMLWSQS